MDLDEISASQCDFDPAVFNARVREKIDEYKLGHPGAFSSSIELRPHESHTLLTLIASAYPESDDLTVLVYKLKYSTHSDAQALQIRSKLAAIYKTGSFQDIFALENTLTAPAPPTCKRRGTSSDSDIGSLQAAFEENYQGRQHELLIQTLNDYWRAWRASPIDRPYSLSISVIQSSGMGKSRMVDEAGKLVFTIPINAREALPEGMDAYPPRDRQIGDYFLQPFSDLYLQARYTIFLRQLFRRTRKTLEDTPILAGLSGEPLAKKWDEYLGEGRTESRVGRNKKALLDKVIKESHAEHRPLKVTRQELGQLTKRMQAECMKLVLALSQDCWSNEVACFVYFDEAHTLNKPRKVPREGYRQSAYQNLGEVLSNLIYCPVFFIFLSTNSHLQLPAPSPTGHLSFRGAKGNRLFPPFTELPFDVFLEEVLRPLETKGGLALENTCKTDTIVGFGRALWYAHHRQWEPVREEHVLDMAKAKLGCVNPPDPFKPQLAALGIRIGITFNTTNPASRIMESELVEYHMRVVYVVPEHGEFMHTGTPSEPILANAAAEYLNQCSNGQGIAVVAPKILATAVGRDLLARGQPESLCGRTIVTIAHDEAVKQYFPKTKDRYHREPRFHQPVPALAFLHAIFPEALYKKILGAKSITRKAGVPTLREAFANGFISFSHFAVAGNSEMLSAQNLVTALLRGMAFQTKHSDLSIHAVIPIHMGPTDAPISAETTSAINLQFHNRKHPEPCYVRRRTTVPNTKMPVLSIVFEFGAEGCAGDRVQITQAPRDTRRIKSKKRTHANDHHYQIVAYGCGSDTFKAIPKEAEAHYETILASRDIIDDFPRANKPQCLEALLNLKPFFNFEGED